MTQHTGSPTGERSSARWTAALLLVTFIWGATFVVVQEAVARVPVSTFNTWRFAIATVALGSLVRHELPHLGRCGVLRGVVLGVVLSVAYMLQTFGLTLTTAPKAAFITGMVVVITPLLQAAVLGRPPGLAAATGAVLAAVGLASMTLEGSLVPALGDLLVLGCAFGFAFHLVGLGAWAGHHPIGALATVQLAASTVAHGLGGIIESAAGGSATYLWVPQGVYVWIAISGTALFASAFAFFAQTGAQRVLSPTRVAVIFTMEPVFAWLTSWLGVPVLIALGVGGLQPETFGVREGVGAVLILVGMLWSELRTPEPADAIAAAETAVIADDRAP